ncbi:hypothetical protein HF086_008437 [Spodoptera exigua]|uniref:Uncharacterized protein n=1 Tax=Spodoptera exigua TaxID=7107 RepID=A0A922SJX3_SPOEX|nr:hypothetical protein HF086_008437 [Spodoptera exigua]
MYKRNLPQVKEMIMNKLSKNSIRILSVPYTTATSDKIKNWPKPDYGPMEVQRSILLNGMRVAAAKPLGAQIGACTVMYQVRKYQFSS